MCSFSQKNDSLIQLSGVIVSEDELEALPYTTVFDRTNKHGVIADYYGYFSLVVEAGDTLYFSFYGHKTSSYIVPDTLIDNRYSIIHMMFKDTINLPQVDIYPWPSREDFARAFVEMEPYEDALRRAQRELSGESLAFAAARLNIDSGNAQNFAANQRNTKLYNVGMAPVLGLFNPYSWAKFISDWKNGELKRQ